MLSFASSPAFACTPTLDGIAVVAEAKGRTDQTIALGRLAAIARRQGHEVDLVQGSRGPVLLVSRRVVEQSQAA